MHDPTIMLLVLQVESLCAPAEKEKAFTKPDISDVPPTEDCCKVRVHLTVEGPAGQLYHPPAAVPRPTMADGETQTDEQHVWAAPGAVASEKEKLMKVGLLA